jgi:hypothetical protein
MNKLCPFILVTLTILSCKGRDQTDANPSFENPEILSIVIDSIASDISPRNLWPVRPPQNGLYKTLTKQDTINHKKGILKYLNKFRTIAIDTSSAYYLPNYELTEQFIKDGVDAMPFETGFDTLQRLKIDIRKIELTKVKNAIYFDSITYLNPSKHIRESRRGTYIDIDYRLNFSRVYYNEPKTKAIVGYQYRYENSHPDIGLFILEKQNGVWKIIDGHRFISY